MARLSRFIIAGQLALLLCPGVFAMGIEDLGKVCLFSRMTGVITFDGKPVANARLTRTVNLTKPISDETFTDQAGRFEFPPAFKRTLTKYLPQEFAANQEIVVRHNGADYRIWSSVKRTPDENSESKGGELDVVCELNSKEHLIVVSNSPIFTRCEWKVDPDKKPEIRIFDDE